MLSKEAFFRFIKGDTCSNSDFNLAFHYYNHAKLEEKKLFFNKQLSIFFLCLKEMLKKQTDQILDVKDIYQKFGIFDHYFKFLFRFFLQTLSKDKLVKEYLTMVENLKKRNIFEAAKKNLWDSDQLSKMANQYHVSKEELKQIILDYANEHYGFSLVAFKKYKYCYKCFRKFLAMETISLKQKRSAYFYYQNYALPEEKKEFQYLAQNMIVKMIHWIKEDNNLDDYLKNNHLTDYDLYFFSTIQSLNSDIKAIIFSRFKTYYDTCLKCNFLKAEIRPKAQERGFLLSEFTLLAKVYAKEVLNTDDFKLREREYCYTKPIYSILASIENETDLAIIEKVFEQEKVTVSNISVFCYCYHASWSKERQQKLEKKFLFCLNAVKKRHIINNIPKIESNSIYYEYLSQELNFIDFCKAKGINIEKFQYAYKSLKDKELALRLKERIKNERIKINNIKSFWCKELVQSIQNGITINGVHRKFNLFDYFYYYGKYQIHKYFLPRLLISEHEKTILTSFFAPLKLTNYVNQDIFLSSNYSIHVLFDENGKVIEGSGTVLDRNDLQKIVNIFIEHHIPFYDILTNIAVRCYANNLLVEEMTLQRK